MPAAAFSVARQAERLGYLPRLNVRQTSEESGGQIYIGSVNWLLFAGVMLLMLTFRESERLATAYGVAVTTDLMLTTALFCFYARAALRWRGWQIAVFVLVFGTLFLLHIEPFAPFAQLLPGALKPGALNPGRDSRYPAAVVSTAHHSARDRARRRSRRRHSFRR